MSGALVTIPDLRSMFWRRPQVVVAHSENIEGVELNFVVVLARVQGIEIRDAVDAQVHGFAIDNEVLLAILQPGLGDPGITHCPISAVARQQAQAVIHRMASIR